MADREVIAANNTDEVIVQLGVRHHRNNTCTSSGTSVGAQWQSETTTTSFEVDFRLPFATFSDWSKVTEVLLEECGLQGSKVADDRARAEAIHECGGNAGQQTLLNALLIESVLSSTVYAPPTSPALLARYGGYQAQQLWLRVTRARRRLTAQSLLRGSGVKLSGLSTRGQPHHHHHHHHHLFALPSTYSAGSQPPLCHAHKHHRRPCRRHQPKKDHRRQHRCRRHRQKRGHAPNIWRLCTRGTA